MLIAIANAKGGTAKTTSSVYLALAATVHGEKALVLDADSQDSASTWADAAEDEGQPLPFEVVATKLSTIAKAVKRDARERDVWRFIDCPPSGIMLDKAIEAADFTIIPTSESSLDLTQAWQTYYAIKDSVPAAVLIVKSETNTTMHRDTLEALDKAETPRFESIVKKRQEIVKSNGHRPKKLFEYADVYSELRKELGI